MSAECWCWWKCGNWDPGTSPCQREGKNPAEGETPHPSPHRGAPGQRPHSLLPVVAGAAGPLHARGLLRTWWNTRSRTYDARLEKIKARLALRLCGAPYPAPPLHQPAAAASHGHARAWRTHRHPTTHGMPSVRALRTTYDHLHAPQLAGSRLLPWTVLRFIKCFRIVRPSHIDRPVAVYRLAGTK